MNTTRTGAEPVTRTLQTEGAEVVYDVRGDLGADTGHRLLLLVGSPMDAYGFTTLASLLTDRTVVTYDPRGAGRSKRTDGAATNTPEEHADDLRRVIEALDVGPVDLLGGSGGAVNALALVAARPDLVDTVVAHEPPALGDLADRDLAYATTHDIHRTYQEAGVGPAMAKFIALTMHQGPLPEDYLQRPAPDPAQFGLPTEDDGSRDDPLVGQNIVACCTYEPDYPALAAASTRVVIGVGSDSAQEIAGRAATAIAERLGTEVTFFPGGHGGYLGDEYGMPGEPEAFAARLREVLDAR